MFSSISSSFLDNDIKFYIAVYDNKKFHYFWYQHKFYCKSKEFFNIFNFETYKINIKNRIYRLDKQYKTTFRNLIGKNTWKNMSSIYHLDEILLTGNGICSLMKNFPNTDLINQCTDFIYKLLNYNILNEPLCNSCARITYIENQINFLIEQNTYMTSINKYIEKENPELRNNIQLQQNILNNMYFFITQIYNK